MKKNLLGSTGIEVTELCFGALPLGPLQANLPEDEGSDLILAALQQGVNFIDTAELYRTYSYIKKALDNFGSSVVIASKSTATSYDGMEKAIQDALRILRRDYLDIFHLHAARVTPTVFEERAGALECLLDYKRKGYIRAVGISTHVVSVVAKAAEVKEIDIVFPIINQIGIGIVGGSREDMLAAIDKARVAGKGLYAMKALGGGHLIDQLKPALAFVRQIPGISSVAVGMVKQEELSINLQLFNDEDVQQESLPSKLKANKRLLIAHFCKACGTCVDACPNGALSLGESKAVVDESKCLLCGYCNPVCPEFALRLI